MRRVVLLLGMIGLAGCAAGAVPPRPEDFPIHERDGVYTLDYRIDLQPEQIEAVGLVTSRTTLAFRFAHLNLFGVAANGRVVSRGSDRVDGTLGRPQSFSVRLKPSGEEVRYQLQVGNFALGLGM
jgi:hypothetical protein